jgi:hypothetical protein
MSQALVRERTIPKVRKPLVGEVSASLLRIDRCRVARTSVPYGRNGFLDPSSYFFFQVAPQVYSRD